MSMSIDEFIKAAQAKARSAYASEIARVDELRVKNISDGSPELNEIVTAKANEEMILLRSNSPPPSPSYFF